MSLTHVKSAIAGSVSLPFAFVKQSSIPLKGAKISLKSLTQANFVPNFVAMATGVGWGKMRLAAFNGPSPKTPLLAKKYSKNLLRKLSYNQFCPKFCCHGNGAQ